MQYVSMTVWYFIYKVFFACCMVDICWNAEWRWVPKWPLLLFMYPFAFSWRETMRICRTLYKADQKKSWNVARLARHKQKISRHVLLHCHLVNMLPAKVSIKFSIVSHGQRNFKDHWRVKGAIGLEPTHGPCFQTSRSREQRANCIILVKAFQRANRSWAIGDQVAIHEGFVFFFGLRCMPRRSKSPQWKMWKSRCCAGPAVSQPVHRMMTTQSNLWALGFLGVCLLLQRQFRWINVWRRTWNDGKGGQCHNLPSADSEFCTNHLKNRQWQVHGRVDGQIPLKKMSEFQLKSKKPSRHSQHVRKVSQK